MNVDTGELQALTEAVEALGRRISAQGGRITRLDRRTRGLMEVVGATSGRLAAERQDVVLLIQVCSDLIDRIPEANLPAVLVPVRRKRSTPQPRPREHLRLVDGGEQ